MTTQTNKPRVACNLKKKKSCVNWFVLEKFFNENATRKKKPLAIDERSEKSLRSKVQIDYRGYFFRCGKGANNIIAVKNTSSVISGVNLQET